MSKKIRALVLLSGLDSILAAKLIQEQGIELIGVTFSSLPFFTSETAKQAAQQLGIPLYEIDISNDFIPVLLQPKYGYGKNINPCIDCHTLMLKKAKELLKPLEAYFIITGEVLGERPMSQNRPSLHIIERDAGVEGLLLRPLSAKLLQPTIPEEKGWVDRDKLLAIQGRSRKPQMELIEKYDIYDYPSPGGGCLLTDPGFTRRFREYLSVDPSPEAADLAILKYGRHFRIADNIWIVVARNQIENDALLGAARPGDFMVSLKDIPGPQTLVRGKEITSATLRKAALLTARYSRKAKESKEFSAIVEQNGNKEAEEIIILNEEIAEAFSLSPL